MKESETVGRAARRTNGPSFVSERAILAVGGGWGGGLVREACKGFPLVIMKVTTNNVGFWVIHIKQDSKTGLYFYNFFVKW